jgi:type II secretory ATPase GspE/PulE/Tfp pilus assembly ATPase PilB-like protein
MNDQRNDIERAIAILVIEHKILPSKEAWDYIEKSRKDNRPLLSYIFNSIPDTLVVSALAKSYGIKYYDLYSTANEYIFDQATFDRAERDMLIKLSALPLKDKTGKIVVAVSNPNDPELSDYLRVKYGQFLLVLSTKLQIQNRLAYYVTEVVDKNNNNQPQQINSVISSNTIATAKSPMQEWLDGVLGRAVSEGASDVHFMFNPDKSMLMRFRVDGILNQQRIPSNIKPLEIIGAIMSRCNMDMSNQREPQDGTFTFPAAGRDIDGRVAMLPQEFGPTLVIRLLDSQNMRTKLEDMGFETNALGRLRNATSKAQGLIIVCGPTGAGKSTTLYGLVREQDAMRKAIFTVENPVEYRMSNIGQTEIKHGLGDKSLSFPRALRTILRLDPDVILVGEIRDQETAEVALQAALTGHLVLTTLHANSAISSYSRLINMGLPRYLVSEAVSLVAAQRLVRKLHSCAVESEPTSEESRLITLIDKDSKINRIKKAVGCSGCNGIGYRGRVAVAEVLETSESIRNVVTTVDSTVEDILATAKKDGYKTLAEEGIRHLQLGTTSLDEIKRVLLFGGE